MNETGASGTKSPEMYRSVGLAFLLTVGCIGKTTAEAEDRVDAPLLRKLVEAPCPNEDLESASVRRSIDRVRAMTGLPALRCDPNAAAAARAHCVYVSTNHVVSHVEDRAKPHFYGVQPTDRMKRAGLKDAPAGEVLATIRSADAVESAAGFLNSVYHRSLFLRHETTSFGYGAADGCATIDFGRASSSAKGATVIWPPNGAQHVPRAFAAENETPNPVPGHAVVGSPVSVIGDAAITAGEAHLRGPKGEVAIKVVTSANDAAKLVRDGELHLVPLAPLAAKTSYTATISGRVAGEAVHFTTTFTTADD